MARTFVIAVPGLTLLFVIRAAVIGGVARYRGLDCRRRLHRFARAIGLSPVQWRRIYPILVDTVSLTGAVMLIIGTATAMAWALASPGSPSG
jgi:TRAP-type C4-dicarboxylate transport system permease large subunit